VRARFLVLLVRFFVNEKNLYYYIHCIGCNVVMGDTDAFPPALKTLPYPTSTKLNVKYFSYSHYTSKKKKCNALIATNY